MTVYVSPERWLPELVRRGGPAAEGAADLDELIIPSTKYLARDALAVLGELVGVRDRLGITHAIALALPLWESDRMLTHPPSLERLLARPWPMVEVPSFLAYPATQGGIDPTVEYFQIPVSPPVGLPEGVSVRYRAYRTLDRRERAWGYKRDFFFEVRSAAGQTRS